jgi:SAM-dependent methyltransferase
VSDYTTVTELPGSKVTREQLERGHHRYFFATGFGEAKDVLEVACGAGLGLGMLAQKAKLVVGGDIDEIILEFAQAHYQGRKNIEIRRLDAQKLPFADENFDLVILYEAIYYLPDPRQFVHEASRVLRRNGTLLIATANKDWADFNPSPFSTRYFSVPELSLLLKEKFQKVEIYGAFPVLADKLKSRIISLIKRIAVALHLMPKTMKGKEIYKRIIFGQLVILPPEIKMEMAQYTPPVPISSQEPEKLHMVIYAVAKKI